MPFIILFFGYFCDIISKMQHALARLLTLIFQLIKSLSYEIEIPHFLRFGGYVAGTRIR